MRIIYDKHVGFTINTDIKLFLKLNIFKVLLLSFLKER